jgi:hypothetical protein
MDSETSETAMLALGSSLRRRQQAGASASGAGALWCRLAPRAAWQVRRSGSCWGLGGEPRGGAHLMLPTTECAVSAG